MEKHFWKKNNRFRWGIKNFYIEFSEPRIQAFDDYGIIHNEEGILYYMYDVELVSRENKEKKVNQFVAVYDFPAIIIFKGILEKVMSVTEKTRGIGHHCSSDKLNFSYYYKLDTGNLFVEDYYEITKHIDKRLNEDKTVLSKNIYYDFGVFLNTTLDESYSPDIKDIITFSILSEAEIQELYKCICSFIEYSIEERNKEALDYIERTKTLYFSSEHHIFKRAEDGNKLEKVFLLGDKLDCLDVLNNKENEDFSSSNYTNVIIKDIKDESFIIDGDIEVKYCDILYMNAAISSEQYYFGINDIVNDFLKRATENEIREFKEEPLENLYEKYLNVFIDRNALFRQEHNFKKYKEDTKENVYFTVKKIIKKIKKTLNSK